MEVKVQRTAEVTDELLKEYLYQVCLDAYNDCQILGPDAYGENMIVVEGYEIKKITPDFIETIMHGSDSEFLTVDGVNYRFCDLDHASFNEVYYKMIDLLPEAIEEFNKYNSWYWNY